MKIYKITGTLDVESFTLTAKEFEVSKISGKNYIIQPDKWDEKKRHIGFDKIGKIDTIFREDMINYISYSVWVTEDIVEEYKMRITEKIENQLSNHVKQLDLLVKNFRNKIL